MNWLRSKGIEIDPCIDEKLEEWKKYRAQKDFDERLGAVMLEEILSRELKKVLEEQGLKAQEEIMKEMQKFGGEPSGEWVVYCDATGIHWR